MRQLIITVNFLEVKVQGQNRRTENLRLQYGSAVVIVGEYVFYVFLIQKTRLFTFLEVAFQNKRKNVIQKFQVSEYIQHYIKIVDSCI